MNYKDLANQWQGWSEDKRLEFAKAFSYRANLSVEEKQILSFLMDSGDDRVNVCIASQVAAELDSNKAFEFLSVQLWKDSLEPKANFIQAVASLKFAASVTTMLKYHEDLRARIEKSYPGADANLMIDFLYCCSSLWKLTGDMSYKIELEKCIKNDHALVRAVAEMLSQ